MDILAGSRDVSLRRMIGHALKGAGNRVETTAKSSVLLVEILDRDFDLVILDTDLEGIDGQETFRLLRQMRPKIPMVFLHRKTEDLTSIAGAGEGSVVLLDRTAGEAALVRAVEETTVKAGMGRTSQG